MLCQKRKPQIDGLLLKSLLHILGQGKYCSCSLNATAIKGYHVLLVQDFLPYATAVKGSLCILTASGMPKTETID